MGPCSSILSTIYSYVSVPVSCLLKAIVSLTVCHFLFSNMLEFNGIRIHFSEDLCLHPGAKEDTRFSPQDGWFTQYLMDPTCAKGRSHPSVFFSLKMSTQSSCTLFERNHHWSAKKMMGSKGTKERPSAAPSGTCTDTVSGHVGETWQGTIDCFQYVNQVVSRKYSIQF